MGRSGKKWVVYPETGRLGKSVPKQYLQFLLVSVFFFVVAVGKLIDLDLVSRNLVQ